MPIEIRELVIRAEVEPGQGQGRARSGSSGGQRAATGAAEHEIVSACVREVMRILERKRER